MFNLQPPRHISTLPDSRPIAVSQQTTFRANNGLMHRSKQHPLFDHVVGRVCRSGKFLADHPIGLSALLDI